MPLPAAAVGAGRVADRNNRRSSTRSSASGETNGTPSAVPRVGGVRCYWAFLRPVYPKPDVPGSKLELLFVHPDPVLGTHLAAQKMSLMGRGVIEFIHPHEREQARHDLKSAILSDDLQGSVTRVRFARLSRLKLILGAAPEDIEYPEFEWQKLVVDEDYLVLDLVLNWIADGMLLAFFHAIEDVDPVANNDINRRDEGWSNFCGTALINEGHITALNEAIKQIIPAPPPSRSPPARVFQLLAPSTTPSPPSLLFSWPPARSSGSYARYDGLYDADEYAGLIRDTNLDPKTLPHTSTTCRTRFGAQYSLTSEGVYRLVTSTFIPYGNLIFACFQTIKMFDLPERQEIQPPPVQKVPAALYAHGEWQPGGASMEGGPSASSSSSSEVFAQQQYQTPDPSQLLPSQNSPITPRTLSNSSPRYVSSPSTSSDRFHPYAYPSPLRPSHPSGPPAHIPAELPNRAVYPQVFQPHPMGGPHLQIHDPTLHAPQIPMPPPPIPPFTPFAPPLQETPQKPELRMEMSSPQVGSSRPLIPPPGDTECCIACGTKESPEWRRSEGGIKDLCNACGLRLARQVAKREGKQKPRKKKEK